jgi:hypothetical protein
LTEDTVVRLRDAFLVILDEVDANPTFARNLDRALNGGGSQTKREPRRGARRAPGVIDPFGVYSDGEPALREALGRLDIEQLKDIIAEHGMDQAKLAMKWKSTDRLVDFIVTTVSTRARKGRAFMTNTSSVRTGERQDVAPGESSDAASENGRPVDDSR